MVKWGCAIGALMVGAPPMVANAQDQAMPASATQPGAVQDQAAPATQGQPPAPAEEAAEDSANEEIVVTGQLRGTVPGDIPPEVQLNPADIRAYGASNVAELIGQLSAQLGTGQGRGGEAPVILLSGRRASMGEVRDLPPEAIERIDILPEEVALKYGYSASQKVINFVLRRRFLALTTEIEGRTPTAGGNAGGKGEAKLDKIRRDDRLSLNLLYDQSSGILESERGVSRAGSSLFDTRGNLVFDGEPSTAVGVPEAAAAGPLAASAFAGAPNRTDVTPYRTLVSPQKKLNLSGVYRRPLSPKISAAATVALEGTESQSLLGLPGITLDLPAGNPYSPFAEDVALLRYVGQSPLTRSNSSRNAELGLTVNGDGTPWADSWRWSFQSNYELNTTQSITDNGVDPSAMQARLDAGDPAFNPFAALPASLIRSRPFDTANTRSSTGRIDMLTNGPLFRLPAGNVNASIRVSGQTRDFSSESFRRGIASSADISRDSANIRGNLDLPIASRRNAVLDAIGDFSLNANFEVEQLSDFGRLTATGYGFNWSPIPQVRALVNWTQDSNAPSPQQLGNPTVTTPNVRVFDYVRGESVDITTITGGNPSLRADSRHVFKAGLNIRPFTETNLTIIANYTNQRYRNTPGNLPGATAEVEAAFPDRFVRDADGQLLSIDYRPVNFASYDHSELRWGFNLFVPIASPAQKRMQARRTAFQAAMAESRRTGQPLPPEMAAQLDQFRRLGQQQSLFGGNQRGQGQRQQGQGQAQGGERPQGEGAPQGGAPGAGQDRGPGRGPGGGFGPGGGGGGRGFGGRGGGFGGNTLQFSLFHTWVFRDQRVIRAGLPVLDYLDGAALGSNGGTPAHKLEFQSGIQRDGYRLRLEGSWESGTDVTTGALGSTDRLDFGSLTKVNLVAQADLGQQLDLLLKHPWLRGTRVSFRVDNLFDTRRRVTDGTGGTPPAYEPDLLDPTGRVVRLSIRKQFF
ncbi:TonB-dependent receptor [Sphingomonas sp. DG1-23]|uniref:TonB-dependent receptor n=1 Tax=Sphingomonas sp. DG1-23 TaxID=3068316 RepID=UPI00273E6C50|nr:TonB-dependent receptor [Sphingomonas sp. DG1-23]MDP5280411.1 TonB-dependent receptor [Sphingomonas sp. DG1-23]